jgi:hypothetical protein
MTSAEHTLHPHLRYLHGNFDQSMYRLIKVPVEISHYPPIFDTFWDWVDSDWAGDTKEDWEAVIAAIVAVSPVPLLEIHTLSDVARY